LAPDLVFIFGILRTLLGPLRARILDCHGMPFGRAARWKAAL
jgi:hypothetical protein